LRRTRFDVFFFLGGVTGREKFFDEVKNGYIPVIAFEAMRSKALVLRSGSPWMM